MKSLGVYFLAHCKVVKVLLRLKLFNANVKTLIAF